MPTPGTETPPGTLTGREGTVTSGTVRPPGRVTGIPPGRVMPSETSGRPRALRSLFKVAMMTLTPAPGTFVMPKF